MNVTEYLGRRSKLVRIAFGLVVFLLVWLIVESSHPDLELRIFYVIPVSYFSWFISRRAGIASVVSAIGLMLMAKLATPEYQAQQVISYWKHLPWLGLLVFIVMTVSELKSLYAGERGRSLTDHLTNIPNRRAFFEYLTAEKNRARRYLYPMTVAYIDLDRFKEINDRLGHATGDRVLARVAEILRETIRGSDFVARIGGDEFALLLPQTDMLAAEVVLAKMQEGLSEAMGEEHWDISFSVGSVTFCPPPDSVEEIIAHADAVMYSVKERGRGGLKQEEMAA